MDTVKIRVGTEASTRELDEYTKRIAALEGQVKKLETSAKSMSKSLSFGDGLNLGLADRALSSLQQIPAIIADGVRQGVQFNATMADSETAIANVLKRFGNLNDVAAKREAAAAMQQLIDLEPKAAGGLTDLVGGFMATVASSQSLGISVENNVALVGKMVNALANTALPIEQLAQEMNSILAGNITADSQLAKRIGITNEDVATAKEAGNLYETLTKKIGTLGEAGDTFGVRWSSFQSALDKTLALATKPFFDELYDGLKTASDLLNDRGLAAQIREVATSTGLLMGAVKGADFGALTGTLGWVAKATGQVTGISALLGVADKLGGTAREKNIGDDMTASSKLVGNAMSAETPEAQATARLAIETRIKQIKDQINSGEIQNSGLVSTTLAYLEKSLSAWDNIAGRSAEHKEEVAKTVVLTKEQLALIEKEGKALEAQMAREAERWAKKEELLTSLREELAIAQASAAGDELRVKNLEIERTLRKDLADIARMDLAPSEKTIADELARQTAELHKQKAIRDQASKSSKSSDDGPGLDPSMMSPISARPKSRSYRGADGRMHYERKGYTDGSATRSLRDSLGGGVDNLAGNPFAPRLAPEMEPRLGGLMAPILGPLMKSSSAGRANPGEMFGPPPPLGGMLPQPGAAPGGGGTGEGGKGGGDGAGAINEAAAAVKGASGDITKAANSLEKEAKSLGSKATSEFQNVDSELQSLGSTIASELGAMAQRISALESRIANAGNMGGS